MAWTPSCPYFHIRELQVEPVLPLMVVSFTTTHSGLAASDGFRSPFCCLPSLAAVAIQTLLPEQSSQLEGTWDLLSLPSPNTRWTLMLFKFTQDPQNYMSLFTLPYEGHTKLFLIILITKKGCFNKCFREKMSLCEVPFSV